MANLHQDTVFVPISFENILACVDGFSTKQKKQLLDHLQSKLKKAKKMTNEEKEDAGMLLLMKEVDYNDLVPRSKVMKILKGK